MVPGGDRPFRQTFRPVWNLVLPLRRPPDVLLTGDHAAGMPVSHGETQDLRKSGRESVVRVRARRHGAGLRAFGAVSREMVAGWIRPAFRPGPAGLACRRSFRFTPGGPLRPGAGGLTCPGAVGALAPSYTVSLPNYTPVGSRNTLHGVPGKSWR